MNPSRIVFIILAVIIGTLIIVAAASLMEFKETPYNIPMSNNAEADRFLALAQSISSVTGLSRYDDASDLDLDDYSLVLLSFSDLEYFDFEQLENFLNNGGRLIITDLMGYDDTGDWPSTGPFAGLEPGGEPGLGYHVSPTDRLEGGDSFASRLINGINCVPAHYFPQAMPDSNTACFYSGSRVSVVIRAQANTYLALLGDASPLENAALKYDQANKAHRQLATFLFSEPYQKLGPVALPSADYGHETQAEPQIPISFWPVYLAIGVLLVLIWWRGSPRFGSLIPDQVAERRSLIERFRSEGRFLWKYKAGNYLLERADTSKSIGKKDFINAINNRIKAQKNRSS